MTRVLLRVVVPIILVVFIFFSLPLVCGHGHSHDHAHAHSHGHAHEEPPAFKWSKQANDPYQEDGDGGGGVGEGEHTPHSHSDPHSHSHSDPHSHSHSDPHSHSHSDPHSHSAPHSHSDPHPHTKSPAAPPRSSVWLEALTATLAISIAPYLILFFIPVTNSKEHQPYLKVLLAFASGGLLGDAFLHLIPHALMAKASSDSHSHSHSHSHSEASGEGHGHDMSIGLAVLGGIIAFLVVEKIVRIFKGGHGHSHGHTHLVNAANGDAAKGEEKGKKGEKDGDKKKSEKKKNGGKQADKKSEGTIKVAGYLNLAADFTHNLTDGLAIGASFLAGKSVGTVTTLTIFLHEIPHEIGDFAILLQSGCSRRKAMMLQLVTALGALTGTCISLLAEGADESAVAWVLPFTAGGFIYIATVSVIPELLENTRFWQSVAEVVALLAGVVLMMGIAHLEGMSDHEH